MAKVTRRVNDPFQIARIAKFKMLKDALSEEPRLCPEHNEVVSAHELPFDNYGASTPNLEIVFSACCDEAITKEIDFVNKTVAEHNRSSDA
jgi:hypothetical protein